MADRAKTSFAELTDAIPQPKIGVTLPLSDVNASLAWSEPTAEDDEVRGQMRGMFQVRPVARSFQQANPGLNMQASVDGPRSFTP